MCNWFPRSMNPYIQNIYKRIVNENKHSHDEFVQNFFSDQSEYQQFTSEFDKDDVSDIRKHALQEYSKLTPDSSFGDIGLNVARDYYAITRKLSPDIAVETGVCNGLSSFAILLALRENGTGQLYSIDYPFRANESLDEFKQDTFTDYGGAAIPRNKDPGWIIPDELRSRWTLIIGKSQRELPRLVANIDAIDLFIHDSEHSYPCMMFEYELAYEWLDDSGVILSDDISWNNAFSTFVNVRKPSWGKINSNVGYIVKDSN